MAAKMNDGHQQTADATIEVIVRRISYETPTVLSYDLRPTNGAPLPSSTRAPISTSIFPMVWCGNTL
jgi:hypothetical protein